MTGPVAVTHHDHTLPSTVSSLLLRDSVHTATVNAACAQFTLFWSTAAGHGVVLFTRLTTRSQPGGTCRMVLQVDVHVCESPLENRAAAPADV